jgi:hypothetical protein
MTNRIITLDEFIIKRQKDFSYATGELTGLLARHRGSSQDCQQGSK